MKRFNGICILSPDVERLANFYQALLQVETQRDGDNITFATAGAELILFSHQGMERMVPGIMDGAGCGSYTIEFEVEDVDLEHEQLTRRGVPCIKPPVTYPWGRRSAWFRDPDGNIVNLYQVVSRPG
jgi:predicted enzyme related to lactoylglutathione lyase